MLCAIDIPSVASRIADSDGYTSSKSQAVGRCDATPKNEELELGL
ncbi:hypothetical protein [Nitrosomonas sp. Nm166]|nr:hypothetical protein [Nitrosomonas sp. Nm166]